MHFIPQATNWTPFRAPIPAISHLVRFDFDPEKTEKVLISSTKYAMDY